MSYSLKDGINDGFLTPFKVKQISTTLDEYVYTPDDKLIEGEVEMNKRYAERDFNKIIEIKEREAHRVKLFMQMIDMYIIVLPALHRTGIHVSIWDFVALLTETHHDSRLGEHLRVDLFDGLKQPQ